MREVEIRRHSARDRRQEHLSEEGRDLARDIGAGRGPFRFVLASPAARAVETAEAMGVVVDRTDDLWYDFGQGAIPWPLSFAEAGAQVRRNPAAQELVARLRTSVLQLVERLDDDERALVVTHGGFPELAAAAWSSPGHLDRLGGPCKCCEGILLRFVGPGDVETQVLRVNDPRTRL